MAREKEDKMAIVKICVEIEMPNDLCDQLEKYDVSFGEVENSLCEGIVDIVGEILPTDTKLKDCYPLGWDV